MEGAVQTLSPEEIVAGITKETVAVAASRAPAVQSPAADPLAGHALTPFLSARWS